MTVEFNLQKGLIGHWTMNSEDTSNNTVYDKSGFDNHGSINGATEDSGLWGDSYSFSEDSDHIDIPTNSVPTGSSPRAFSVWVNVSQNGERQVVLGTGNGGLAGNAFEVEVDDPYNSQGPNNVGVHTWASSITGAGTPLEYNEWTHIVAQLGEGNQVSDIDIYVNSEKIETEVNDGSTIIDTVPEHLSIGSSLAHGDTITNYVSGKVQDARIYNRVLTKDEISALYNMRSQRKQNLKTNVTYNDTQQLYDSQGHPDTTSAMDEFFNLSNSDVTNILSTKHERASVNHGSTDQSTSEFGTVNSLPKYFTKEDGYSWKIEGKWTAPETGTYTFGIDGDDAMDFLVDGNPVVTFYGGHGFDGTVDNNSGTITLTAGERYNVAFRYEEGSGGNGATLGYKKPSDSNYVLFPVQQVF